MGPEIGRYLGQQIVGMIILAFVVGGVIGVGGWLLIGWIASHITIGWS